MLVANNANPLAVRRPSGGHTEPDQIRSRELSAITVLITARGEVDAANAGGISDHIDRRLAGYRQLVLDFSKLEFCGTAGFSVLHWVRSRCERTGTDWVLVPGPEVVRVLRVCDPDRTLPTASNIVSAVATLTRHHVRRVG